MSTLRSARPWLNMVSITKEEDDGIARTVASASALRDAGVEQIVVDGRRSSKAIPSSDLSGPGVTVYQREAKGISDAFNAGLSLSGGEWIWFLNGGDRVDERLDPDLLRALLAKTRADVVIGGITYDGQTELQGFPPNELRWPPILSWIPHPSTIVRRSLFEQFGNFDERYKIAMDYEWWLRVFSKTIAVDIVMLPFAVFAAGGISQRPEMKNTIRGEKSHALWRHRRALWRQTSVGNFSMLRTWFLALGLRPFSNIRRGE